MKKNSKIFLGLGAVATLAAPIAAVVSCSCSAKTTETALQIAIRQYKQIHDQAGATVAKDAPTDATKLTAVQTETGLQAKPESITVQMQTNSELKAAMELISKVDTMKELADAVTITNAITVINKKLTIIEKWNAAVDKANGVAAQPVQQTTNTPTTSQPTSGSSAKEAEWQAQIGNVKQFNMFTSEIGTYSSTAGVPVNVLSTLSKNVVADKRTSAETTFLFKDGNYVPFNFTAAESAAIADFIINTVVPNGAAGLSWMMDGDSTSTPPKTGRIIDRSTDAGKDKIKAFVEAVRTAVANEGAGFYHIDYQGKKLTGTDASVSLGWDMPAYTAYFTDGTDRVTALALNKLIRTFADLTNPNAVASLGGAADFNAKYPLMNITAGINKLAQIFNADKTDGHTLDVIRATEDHYNKITTTFSGYNAVANAAEAIIGVSSAVPGQSTSNPLVTAATNSYEAMYELQGMPAFKTMEELHQYFLAH